MAEAVGAEKGERIEGRLSSRSGYYTRGLVTRVGNLKLRVPQDRNGRFSTEIFERYRRSEKALVAAFTQMSIQQRLSIRKVQAISEELCGHSLARARSVRSIKSSMPN
jgi:putative transposase